MSIGSRLKEAREKRHLTLKQAYEKTRIYPDILEALEQNNYKRIPNQAYVKSFLKEYASFLRLNVDEILEEYNKSKAQRQKKPAVVTAELQTPPQPIQSGIEAVRSLSKIIALAIKWAVILTLAVIIMLGVVKLFQAAAKNIKLQQKQGQAGISQKKILPKQVRPAEKPQQRIIIPKDKELSLTIKAAEDVWFQLKVDGRILFENILKKDASETWKGKENFTLSTGKAKALRLSLNGNDLGYAGKGAVKNLTIDREGLHK